jgi:ferrous iron transport protein B
MECHTCSTGDKQNDQKNEKSREGLERIALIGTPNVGKSVLFGLMTGKYATVSNYPGTTVEVTYGNLNIADRRYLLVDTPGANSLIPQSEDEQVTRDILLNERPTSVVQVGDSKNLKRTLAITVQLSEMGLPITLCLNMEDEASDRGISIDTKELSNLLSVDVVSTVAPERRGLKELRSAIASGKARVPAIKVTYPEDVEEYIQEMSDLLPEHPPISRRSLAIMLLSGDMTLRDWLTGTLEANVVEEIEALRSSCHREMSNPFSAVVQEAWMRAADEMVERVMTRQTEAKGSLLYRLGQATMHPLWGIPILLGVLWGLYQFVGVLGADIMVGFVEETLFGEYLNPMFTYVVENFVPTAFLKSMLVGEYGIITMAITYAVGIILPITATFFIAFSVLEDSGYLPRLAIMSNRLFNIMGLSGKAVLPMVLGLGCGTMAVMTTRVLETKRDRIIATFLLALAVPCAAQLGVIMGIIGSLSGKAMAIWVGVIIGLLLFTGWLASKIVRGDRSDFLLEIPPLRIPKLGNIMVKTLNRVVWYLKEAVPLFIYGTLALFFLDQINMLVVIERALSPVIVGVLDLPVEATEAFLIGFFRRDYGAAGLYALNEGGLLSPVQTMVSLVTLTLFVPCLAHFFMMIKERGMRASLIMLAIIIPTAVGVGGALNYVLRTFNIQL